MAEIVEVTEKILRDIRRDIASLREMSERSLQLSQRAIARTDALEARLDAFVASVHDAMRDMRSDLVSSLAAISAKLGVDNG